MSENKQYQINPDVSCGHEEDGAVLFNPDTNNTSMLNLSGSDLWTFLETPRTLGEIAAHMVATYHGVTAEQASEDAEEFVRALMPDFVLEMDDDN